MDAAACTALGVALQHELSTALADAMLALERQRMLTEDIAAHALAGKVSCNPGLDIAPGALPWIGLVDDQRERSRLALQRFEVIGVPAEEGFQLLADEVRDLLDPDIPVDLEEYEDFDMEGVQL